MSKQQKLEALAAELGYALVAKPVEAPKMVEKTNLMTGKKYMEEEGTPRCCSPASELYWSM